MILGGVLPTFVDHLDSDRIHQVSHNVASATAAATSSAVSKFKNYANNPRGLGGNGFLPFQFDKLYSNGLGENGFFPFHFGKLFLNGFGENGFLPFNKLFSNGLGSNGQPALAVIPVISDMASHIVPLFGSGHGDI